MIRVAHDHMIEHLDFEELARPDEVAGHFDVRLGRRRLAARVIVLCVHPSYVQLFRLSPQTSRFGRFDQAGFFT